MKLAAALLALSARLGAASTSADDCPAPGGPGPYKVGFSGWQDPASLGFAFGQFASASSDRALDAFDCAALPIVGSLLGQVYPNGCIPFELTYPTDSVTGANAVYPTIPNPSDPTGPALLSLTMNSIANAPLSDDKTCWPLVVYSHGNLSFSEEAYELKETLASLGYLVAAPTHSGNSLLDAGFVPDPSDPIYLLNTQQSRYYDVISVLDAIDLNPLLPICPGQVVVLGLSFGANTALVAANGLTTTNIDAVLNAAPGTVQPVTSQLPGDERIKAAVAMTPFTLLLSGNPFLSQGIDETKYPGLTALADLVFPPGPPLVDLEDSDVPTLVLAAEFDRTTPIPTNTDPLWDTIQCTTEQTYRADIAGAGHSFPGSGCSAIEQGIAQIFAAFSTPLGGQLSVFDTFTAAILNTAPQLAFLLPLGDDPSDTSDIDTVCSLLDPALDATGLVEFYCTIYWNNVPTQISSGCLVGQPLCQRFAGIKVLLDLNTSADYVSSVYGSLVYGSPPGAQSFLTECGDILLPTLTGDEALNVVATYVTAFLETVLERDDEECYEDVLEEEYAAEEGLPVLLGPDQLFLEDFVEDVCELSSGSEDESVRNLRACKAF